MKKRLTVLLCVLVASSVLANVGVFSDTGNPIATQAGYQTSDTYVPEVIVCGARLFLAAAMYNHTDLNGYDFYCNDQGLRLVYNCMTYLLDPENQSVTSGTIGCMGDFDLPNGLQEGTDAYPPWDIDFMQYVEDNLTGEGCTFDLVHITNSDPLIDAGQPLYDIVMIGEEWESGLLHTRSEYSNYVALGGKIILGPTWNTVPDPGGLKLSFLPKNSIWIERQSEYEFLLPAEDPFHPIAKNMVNPEWWYDIYQPAGGVINPHNYVRCANYDDEYYYKVFAKPPQHPDTPATVVVGGQYVNEVAETSWGAIKAQF